MVLIPSYSGLLSSFYAVSMYPQLQDSSQSLTHHRMCVCVCVYSYASNCLDEFVIPWQNDGTELLRTYYAYVYKFSE